MPVSKTALDLIARKRRICGQTGGHVFGRGYPTVTGKYTEDMTPQDREKLRRMLSQKPKTPQGGPG